MTTEEKTQKKYYVTSFYHFFEWEQGTDVHDTADSLEAWCRIRRIRGLIIMSDEGFNGTIAAPTHKYLDDFKDHLLKISKSSKEISFKDSFCNASNPFRRTKVKIRDEIVTIGNTEINPAKDLPKNVKHLSPKQWHEFINKNPSSQIVDVRNDYEIEIGSFKGAKNWKMEEFTEFPELTENSDFDKNKPVLMFCTGGIRCEKASIEMSSQGYKEVYQLDGGILNYLAEYPDGHFNGECFVFDHRVAVDKNLEPSKNYTLCTHCGQPANKESFDCVQCGDESYGVCHKCWDESTKNHTCSKNCAHHFTLGHVTKNKHKDSKRIKYSV